MDFYENFQSSSFRLDPREHVRMRPGMYVGGTGTHALHHLIYEVLDHMAEEAFLGRCDYIEIELRHENEVLLRDNGVGLPTAQYKDTPFTETEVLLQDTAASKSYLETDPYYNKGGLQGFGLAVVNILCDQFIVENYRDGVMWRQSYAYGKPTSPLIQMPEQHTPQAGTTFVFHPDYSIFDENQFDVAHVEKRAKEVAFLIPNLSVEVRDVRVDPVHVTSFHYPEGLKSLVTQLNADNHCFHEPVYIDQTVSIPQTDKPDLKVVIQIAFQFSDGEDSYIRGYVNNVETSQGGTHLTALKAALLSCLNEYMESHPTKSSSDKSFIWDDIAVGLAAVVSIYHPDPRFVGAIKVQLANTELFGPVAGLVFEAFNELQSRNHYEILDAIIRHHLSRR